MRSLRTPETNVRRTAGQRLQPKTRTAFLLDAYPGYALMMLVQFNDPRTGVRGTVVRASVKPGLGSASLPAGTPVTVVTSHGQSEVVGLGIS